jgi:hypothetical protein
MIGILRHASAVAALCALPCAASAQTWADALKKGDYQTAAALLQPLAIQALLPLTPADPEPVRQLALMYAQGLGVPVDPVMACGLAQVSGRAIQPGAINSVGDIAAYEARVKAGDDFFHRCCDTLSEYDRANADRIGCFSFGMPDETLTLGSDAIRVDRAGIRLVSDTSNRFEAPVNCPQLIARVRALTIEPPADAAPGVKARYFVDVLAWSAGQSSDDAKALRYVLGWQLYELRGKKLELVTLQELDFRDAWPSPALPPDFDTRFTIEMIRSGHVHWRMAGAPPKRGWVMLPEKQQ